MVTDPEAVSATAQPDRDLAAQLGDESVSRHRGTHEEGRVPFGTEAISLFDAGFTDQEWAEA